jgi:hypothetical protein
VQSHAGISPFRVVATHGVSKYSTAGDCCIAAVRATTDVSPVLPPTHNPARMRHLSAGTRI